MTFYKVLVRPVATRDSETWTLTKIDEKTLASWRERSSGVFLGCAG
jgi:hypothetical protein